MRGFQFLSNEPKPGDDGIYQVMSDDLNCKIEIVDVGKNKDRFYVNQGERLYTDVSGEGTNYAYKLTLLDCSAELTEPQRQYLFEKCWDWFLSYYLA